jgi:hypothetical protein
VHGAEPDKDAALALAEAMIRDGRMPDPETAKRNREASVATPWAIDRKQRRERRARQPAEIRKREEKLRDQEQRLRLSSNAYEAEAEDRSAIPLYEALADAFNFSDPDLWKSNSFAALKPRLVLHVRAVVARLESQLADTIHKGETQPFSMWPNKEQRKNAAERRRRWASAESKAIQARLDRALDILRCLEGGPA